MTDVVNLVTGLGIGAVLVAIVGWLKDRRKLASDVNLTDVQTLQSKLAYLEKVIENIDAHTDFFRYISARIQYFCRCHHANFAASDRHPSNSKGLFWPY